MALFYVAFEHVHKFISVVSTASYLLIAFSSVHTRLMGEQVLWCFQIKIFGYSFVIYRLFYIDLNEK